MLAAQGSGSCRLCVPVQMASLVSDFLESQPEKRRSVEDLQEIEARNEVEVLHRCCCGLTAVMPPACSLVSPSR